MKFGVMYISNLEGMHATVHDMKNLKMITGATTQLWWLAVAYDSQNETAAANCTENALQVK